MTEIEKARAYFDNILMAYLEPSEAHAYTLAVEALEKQVPKRYTLGKPYVWYDCKSSLRGCKQVKKQAFTKECPVCKTEVTAKPNFCPHCGQCIDWSDEDEI